MQRPRRTCERTVRCRAVLFQQWTRNQGLSVTATARCLGIAPRTLAAWCQQQQAQQLTAMPRGRPCHRAPVERRNEVIGFLQQVGPGLGVPSLQAHFRDVPRRELAELLRRFRRIYRSQHRRRLNHLRWQLPGSVWAIDHCEATTRIEDRFPYILNVRDLASGTVLAWEPVESPDAASTTEIIARLFQKHRPPLVLKSDNGSAFIAAPFTELLTRWNVIPLRSPPRCPQYNGSCEAGGGAMKKRTAEQATLAGHPAHWTIADLHRARIIANVVLHPHGAKSPAPIEVWQQRQPISSEMRAAFSVALERHRQRAREDSNVAANDLTRRTVFDQIDRVAIGRTLVEFDLVRFTKGSFTPPLNPQLLANIT